MFSYSLTLIDALDTLAIIGNYSEFHRVHNLLISSLDFDRDINVSVFETNIRGETMKHTAVQFVDRIFILVYLHLPSVLWRCWLGGRKGIRPVKKQIGWVLAWLSVWSEMQTCMWPSWCRCHSLSLASVKSRLVLPFWYRLTWVVPEKGPLNGCVCVFTCTLEIFLLVGICLYVSDSVVWNFWNYHPAISCSFF